MYLSELTSALLANLAALVEDFTSADQLAAKLSNMGHCGGIGSAGDCPVAVYLKVAGGFGRVRVDGVSITIYDRDATWATVATPDVVSAFIRAFDRGRYPELLAYDPTDYDQLVLA